MKYCAEWLTTIRVTRGLDGRPVPRHSYPCRIQTTGRERARLGWSLTAAVLFVYFAFILIIAFQPALLATPITEDSTITWGIPIGLFVILFSFALTGFYTYRANTCFDPA